MRPVDLAGGWLAWVSAGTLVLGCVQREEGPKPPVVFGGEGARVSTLDEKPLPATDQTPEAKGPCGREAPPSDTALLDDFEDGDGTLFKGFEREGYWFTVSDSTPGSVLSPVGTFAAELLPAAEGSRDNRYAAHLSASGQKQWGATWGSTLAWTKKGIHCPLNLSGFAGLRFRAKGPGRIRVALAVPEVMPKEYSGTCADRCYDFHGKPLTLSDHWEAYSMRWDRVQQEGWGAEARFTPSRVVQLSIKADLKSLPSDFWVDDLELIPKDEGGAAATAAKGR